VNLALIEDGGEYEDQTFSRLVEAGRVFEAVSFTNCVFDGCSLGGCTLYRCSFVDCRFAACDLSNAKVPNARFRDVAFAGSKLLGIDWTVTGDATATRLPLSIGFEDCVVSYASFVALRLRGLQLHHCVAQEADFTDADLTEATLRESDLTGARFGHTNLTRADFRDAYGYAIDPTINPVKGARFSLPEAASLLRTFGVIIT